MKLLSPSEVQDERSQQLARDAMRTREMSKAADEARKRLANAEADFSQVMAGQRTRWANEEQEHTKIVAERRGELSILEARRQKALEPIESIKKQAKEALLEAQNELIGVQSRENDVEDLKELLEAKLDAVGVREQDVLTREQKANATERNLETQQRICEDNMAFVAQHMKTLQAAKDAYIKETNDLKMKLLLRERSLDARSDKLDNTEKQLEVLRKQLEDERGTLERAFKRISYPHIKKKKKV